MSVEIVKEEKGGGGLYLTKRSLHKGNADRERNTESNIDFVSYLFLFICSRQENNGDIVFKWNIRGSAGKLASWQIL